MLKMNKIFKKRTCLSRDEIELYLEGKLNNNERFDIENHLLDCPLCSDAVDGFFSAKELIHTLPAEWLEIKSDENKLTNVIGKTNQINLFRLAAVFTGIVVFAGLAYQYFAISNSEKLFAGAYKLLPPGDSNTRSIEIDSLAIGETDQAMILYGQQDYAGAMVLFEQRLKQYPKDNESHLYSGICCLELNDIQKAKEHFVKARINSEKFYASATWYLALCYIRLGQFDQAKQLLNELTNEQNDYMQKAKELLTQLDK